MINLLALQRKLDDLANYKISLPASPVQELLARIYPLVVERQFV
ncbi:hypothetical protein [Nostoc sp. DedQUE04]|nr:hypothetical protein [Nostoc sp. DedQUE04]